MGNDEKNGSLMGLPSWARAAATIGTPSVIAIILVAVLVGAVPSAVTKTQDAILINQGLLRAAAENREKDRKILLQICRNTAKTEAQTVRCDDL